MNSKKTIIQMLIPVVIEMSFKSRVVYPKENFLLSVSTPKNSTSSYVLVDLLCKEKDTAFEYLNKFGITVTRKNRDYIFTR